MNDSIETVLRAELTTLRQRLDKLEAEHREVQAQAFRARRPTLSRNFGLLVLVLTSAAVGVLWGQQAMSLFIDSKGNVGIGTTSPSANLQVGPGNFGGVTTLGVTQRNSDKVGLSVRNSGKNAVQEFCTGNKCKYLQMTAEGDLWVGGENPPSMVVMENGKVGIGTNTPDLPLVVGATGGGPKIAINDYPKARWAFGTGDFMLHIANDSPGPSWTDRLVINQAGNVGIGMTTFLTEKLNIAGNAKVSGALTVGSITGGLKVTNGEIKGRLWKSQVYKSQAPEKGIREVKMTNSTSSICFLEGVTGELAGFGEAAEVVEKQGYWYLVVKTARTQLQASAVCIGSDGNP